MSTELYISDDERVIVTSYCGPALDDDGEPIADRRRFQLNADGAWISLSTAEAAAVAGTIQRELEAPR